MARSPLTDPDQARTSELITKLPDGPIAEIAQLGRTRHAWRTELLAHSYHPDVTNGPTENLTLTITNTKRIARGYRNLTHYRLRLFLNHSRTHEDHTPTRIRTRHPRFVA